MAVTIRLRRDTAANWTAANPTLASAEPGLETDTGKIKFGDGATAWNSLDYFATAAVAFDLDDAGDVVITSPADNEVLAYDSGSGNWINQTAAEAGLSASSHDHDADYDAIGAAATVQGNLDTHEGDTANPHAVTAAQVGAVPLSIGIVAVSGAHTLLAANNWKTHEVDGTVTVTLPDGLAVNYQVIIVNVGTDPVTLSADTTLVGDGNTLADQWGTCSVYHRGSNVWVAKGELTSV